MKTDLITYTVYCDIKVAHQIVLFIDQHKDLTLLGRFEDEDHMTYNVTLPSSYSIFSLAWPVTVHITLSYPVVLEKPVEKSTTQSDLRKHINNHYKPDTIFQNAIRTPDGIILNSINRHDYLEHKGYMIDGGTEYFKCNFSLDTESGLSFSDKTISIENDFRLDVKDSDHDIAHKLLWGVNSDKDRKLIPFSWKPLGELESSHLLAILRTQPNLQELRKLAIHYVLEQRLNT